MTNPNSPYGQVKAALEAANKATNYVDIGEQIENALAVLPALKPAEQPDKAAVQRAMAEVERANYRPREYSTVVIERATVCRILTKALAAQPQVESGLVEELQAELRHFKGRPAVDGKPLDLQTRDELLAAVHGLQAENDRLSFEANSDRQAEAEADAEAKELAEALESALGGLCACRHISPIDGELLDAEIAQAKTALARYKAQQAAEAV